MKARVQRFPNGWVIRNNLLQRDTNAKDRRSTAVHEAGHAVVAHLLGLKVHRLWLHETNQSVGRCEYRMPLKPCRFVRAAVSLAGHESEVAIYRRPITKLPAGDYAYAQRLGFSPRGIRFVAWAVRRIVRRHKRKIRGVARVLLAKGELTRRQFLKAYREA